MTNIKTSDIPKVEEDVNKQELIHFCCDCQQEQ